jgi:opine dehydrogenase
MDIKRIAVIGAGNSGYAMAADFSLAGYEVSLCEVWDKQNLEPIVRSGGIELTGISRNGFARIRRVTANIAEALEGAKFIMVATQSLGHETVAELCAPHLEDGQIIVLLPGNFGSVLFARILKEKGLHKNVKIAETSTFPYAARRVIGEAKVNISQFLNLYTAAFPARDTMNVLENIKQFYPTLFFPAKNVLEVAMSNPNFFHLPICILNTARIEKSQGGKFYPYSDGVSPSVVKIIEAVWRERGAVLRELGLIDLSPVEEHKNFFANLTPAQAVITGPANMQHRMISEDCPCGLVPLSSIGEMIGVPTPVTRALITLASKINGTDYYVKGRNVEYLGISGLNKAQLTHFFS